MTAFLVSGLINIETTLQVEGFPIPYDPVHYPFHGIRSSVSGVGYNIAKALTRLGDPVQFLSLIGQDLAGQQVQAALEADGIPTNFVLKRLEETAQSVILYEPGGRRQIHVDLKDIQEQSYPAGLFDQAAQDCSLAVLCNINFSRALLARTRQKGMHIATDVHALSDLDDAYNADFMRAADILFLSNERLPVAPETWARHILDRYGNEILVIGLGAEGALLAVRRDQFLERIPAIVTRPVINTIGAGDALFSCFLHYYGKTMDPYGSIQKAMTFASYKIGAANGAADGFLTETELEQWLLTGAGAA